MPNLLLKRHVFIVAFFIHLLPSSAQSYFQQQVSYIIEVRLNDSLHTLSANEQLTYVNNSSTTLEFLYFHLWPNAYQPHSHLDKQLLLNDKTGLHYSKLDQRGGIDSLNFTINGQSLKWHYLKDTVDAAVVYLNQPLHPGDSVIIKTPFRVKIPSAEFSRLGHTSQAYFITQWYPKPAVFDKSGWHVMPYLNQGEFYSEFGNFDVRITLPANYIVAATGDRYDSPEDDAFMQERLRLDLDFKVKDSSGFPKSATVYKTVKLKQSKVHDFAWFADKRFMVRMESFTLPASGRTVHAYAYFTETSKGFWKEGARFVKDAVLFYSAQVGEYPYQHASAVDGEIMAGGGMEYPNVTVINTPSSLYDLDVVIAHEVGHNWFYGILGNNERDDAFMDEGLNSFYEMQYVRSRYPKLTLANFVGKDASFKIMGLNEFPVWKEKDLLYMMSARPREDQSLQTLSPDFTDFNYGAIVYSKSPVIMDYLRNIVGPQQFDSAMHVYYKQWSFKHPTREDLINSLSVTLQMDLNWFNKYYLQGKALPDYRVGKPRRTGDSAYVVRIRNVSRILSPFILEAVKNETLVAHQVIQGFKGRKKIVLNAPLADKVVIDNMFSVPDRFKNNNTSYTSTWFKRQRSFQLKFGTAMEHPSKRRLYWLPVVAGNYYNGFLPGMVLHNYGLVSKRLEFYVAPMFGLRNHQLAGGAEVTYARYFDHFLKQITLGVKARRYAYNEWLVQDGKTTIGQYTRFTPFVVIDFRKRKPNSPFSHQLAVSANQLLTDSLKSINGVQTVQQCNSMVTVLVYEIKHKHVLNNWQLQFQAQQSAGMTRIQASFNQVFNLNAKNTMRLKAFVGTFVSGSDNERRYYAFRGSGYSGADDYLFVMNHMGRNLPAGPAFSQFMEGDGTLKIYAPQTNSTQWMAAIGVKSPAWKMFRLYADAVMKGNKDGSSNVYYDGGVNVSFSKEMLELYFPLFYSKIISDNLKANGISWAERIRFTMNIHKLAPSRLIRESIF